MSDPVTAFITFHDKPPERVEILVVQAGSTGTTLALSQCDIYNQHKFKNPGNVILAAYNGDFVPHHVTLHTDYVVDGLKLPDKKIECPPLVVTLIGPLDPTVYNTKHDADYCNFDLDSPAFYFCVVAYPAVSLGIANHNFHV